MSHSFVKNYVHIIFSTKFRKHRIYPPVENRLHSYIGGICSELDCLPINVGGYTNHIHVLCHLSKKLPLCILVQKIKQSSSKWIKTKSPELSDFFWQNGYAAFSVYPKDLDVVKGYIANQHNHHLKKSFEKEYKRLLEEHNFEYDERYMWE